MAATIGGGVGLVLGALAVAATRMSERARTEQPPPLADLAALPRGVVDVLGVLRSIAIVLDASGLAAGVYAVRVETASGPRQARLVRP